MSSKFECVHIDEESCRSRVLRSFANNFDSVLTERKSSIHENFLLIKNPGAVLVDHDRENAIDINI